MSKALEYHKTPTPGKIEISLSKTMQTEADLALAYSPGVAEPVIEIAKDAAKVYDYTIKGNLVGVISNGTAILGLGNKGALASKPVMEGKAALFKKFADINAFDIEINSTDPEQIIKTIADISPTFGGINLEDFKAPECFLIEEELQKILDIPVFHDDQHGTAITMTAALINACKLQNKSFKNINIVIQGAGASALACANFLTKVGVTKQQLILIDSKGVISTSRTDLNKYKQKFANETNKATIYEAIKNADVFIGLAGATIDDPTTFLESMNSNPILFTLSNPTPSISYDLIKKIRQDSIIATGLSNLPNQVNNAVCFPYIFKGALQARAKSITIEMQLAAAYAIADIVNQPVRAEHRDILPEQTINKDYILPKPYDPRLLEQVTKAVADAA
jgi:malate dehydrogenase (oxaloacetate-decarboxylating)(NADP+)